MLTTLYALILILCDHNSPLASRRQARHTQCHAIQHCQEATHVRWQSNEGASEGGAKGSCSQVQPEVSGNIQSAATFESPR